MLYFPNKFQDTKFSGCRVIGQRKLNILHCIICMGKWAGGQSVALQHRCHHISLSQCSKVSVAATLILVGVSTSNLRFRCCKNFVRITIKFFIMSLQIKNWNLLSSIVLKA